MQKLKEPSLNLREGQIIQGKILKLYPNNRAQIQLGFHQLIAQLEASLTLGEKYFFQVQNTDNLTQLKVIGDTLNHQSQTNLEDFVRQLGIKPTKTNLAFVDNLFQNKIPFDKAQLQQALALVNRAENKTQAIPVLKGMIENRLPMTDTVFQALFSKASGDFTDAVRQFGQDIPHQRRHDYPSELIKNITEQLAKLSGTSKINLSSLQPLMEDQAISRILKASGVLQGNIQFSSLSDTVNRDSSQLLKALNPQFDLSTNQTLIQNLSKIETIIQNANYMFNKWGEVIQTSISNNTGLKPDIFTSLMQDLAQNPITFSQNKQSVLLNQPQQLQTFIQDLNVLTHKGNYEKLDRVVFQLVKDIFLDQTNQVLKDVGLNYEKVVAQEENNPTNTLKGMLMQLVQSGDTSTTNNEQASKLLHFINGLQLQSVNESAKFIEANLVLPGGSLGLEQDVEMTFEGQKDDNGEINPNFCRIVFYLDLANIKKTVVDMNVQKRAVSLTILNDFPIDGITNAMKPLLKEGLQQLDYHLSSVTHRPLTNQESVSRDKKITYKAQQVSYEGVDFRI